MRITKELLKEWSACHDGYRWFLAKFPQGGDVQEVGAALREDNRTDDASWLTSNVFAHFIKAPEFIGSYTEGEVKAVLKLVEGSPNTASGNYSTSAASGNYSKSAASGNYSTATAQGGKTIAMVAGLWGKASAGELGAFALPYLDAEDRIRIAVGIVGEDGIKADTLYEVVDGKLSEVQG